MCNSYRQMCSFDFEWYFLGLFLQFPRCLPLFLCRDCLLFGLFSSLLCAFFNLLCLSLSVIFTFVSYTLFVTFVKAKPHTPNSLSFLWWWWTTDSCVITFFCCSISRHLSFEFLPRPLPNPSISYIPVPSLWVIYFDADFCFVVLLTSYSSELLAVTRLSRFAWLE